MAKVEGRSLFDSPVGSFCFGSRMIRGKRFRTLVVKVPGDERCTVPIYREGEKEPLGEPGWLWNGDENRPTLHPSLQHPDPGGWHGFVENGELLTV